MSDIDWDAIHAGLIAPFDPAVVEFRPQGPLSEKGNGRALAYIDARAVMDRLDAVVGPENWYGFPDVLIADNAVRVVRYGLTIHGVTKYAIGDAADTEASKSADSDGLKRAGVPWGIGRYLYSLDTEWVKGEKRGAGWIIPDAEIDRLRAKLAAQRPRQQAQETRNGHEATPTTPQAPSAAIAPAGAVSESNQPPRVTDEQQAQIRNLIGGSGMVMDELLDQLNITSLGDLTAERARKVIDRLTQLGQDRQARAAQTAPDPNSPVGNTPRLKAVR